MRILMTALLLTSTLVSAQEAPPEAPGAPPPPCSGPEYREFDFWVGSWNVTQNGKPAGTNRITREDGDCVLVEHWASAAGNFTGHSLNTYNRITGLWHQTWADSGGNLLQLDGGLKQESMVLEGETSRGDGRLLNRISWTPMENGVVRQHWETSADAGESWTTVFDGRYERVKASP